ncbi:DUF3558 domain-containing protein [Streptomyces sp. MN03-5084-2B]|nr:DUF3558 domain-containing protein [Streptomyces sp. MN03-5084-2B]
MKRHVLVGLGATLLTVAACTSTQNGTASPSSTDAITSQTGAPHSGLPDAGAPEVAVPIDTTDFQQKPCSTLTAAQIAELLGPDATPKEDPNDLAGPSCFWHPTSVTQATVSVIYNTKNKRGLSAIYEKQGTTFPLFVPMEPIEGYPTVAYGQADLRSKGSCAIALGTSDQQIVDVSVALSEGNIGKKDPCAAAHEVTTTVLNNLRAR